MMFNYSHHFYKLQDEVSFIRVSIEEYKYTKTNFHLGLPKKKKIIIFW